MCNNAVIPYFAGSGDNISPSPGDDDFITYTTILVVLIDLLKLNTIYTAVSTKVCLE